MGTSDRHTTAALITQLGEDSQEALAGLMQIYRPLLSKVINLYTRDQNLTEEIFLDVMQTLWQKRKQVASLDNPYTWLVKVAQNKAMNKLRDLNRGKNISIELVGDLPADTNTETSVAVHDLESMIEQAARTLSPREQQVFALSVTHGWNNKAIAQQLKVSESTIRTQLANALKKIRIALSKFYNNIII